MKKFFTSLMLSAFIGLSAIAQIPTNGLVGYYPFNSNANDESGNGNNGTVNGATLTTDRFGNVNSAYSFNGSSNNIMIPNSASFAFDTLDFTISIWLKYNSQAGGTHDYAAIFIKALLPYPEDGITFFVDYLTPNKISYRIARNEEFYSTANALYGQWHNLIFQREKNYLKLFINGVLDSSYQCTNINCTNNQPIWLGCNHIEPNTQNYDGILDDISIYNRALNEQEIHSLYNENICKQSITVTDTLVINAVITNYNPITFQNSIKVFPNPTLDKITIDCGSNYSTLNGYTIKITNSLSQTVYESLVNKQTATIDLNTWTGTGIYFVHLIDGNNNTIEIKKIVLQ